MGGVISKRQLSIDSRINYLKKTPFFLYLKGERLKQFAECFPYVKEVKQSESVILEQETIYIVARGELQLYTTLPATQAKIENKGYLCKKYPGDIFSKTQAQSQAERKLSDKNKKLLNFVEEVQTAACTKTLILYSDNRKLDHFLSVSKELVNPINSIIKSHIETSLTGIPFLKTVKDSQLSVLAAMCQYEAVDANEVVFKENSCGTKLYILLNGSATVLAPQWVNNATTLQQSLEWGASADKIVVADLENGDYFGETAMFVNVNRTSTVVAKEKCLFVTVEKKTFENFLKVCPIRDAMTSVMKERMVSKLSSLEIPFLMGIPPEKLKSLKTSVEIHDTGDGDVIFREGEKGGRFYIIVHGQVKVETSNPARIKNEVVEDSLHKKKVEEVVKTPLEESKSLGLLNAGNYFGEMALVSDSPRSATVITIGKTILLSVDKESFHSIFASNDQALAEFKLRLLRGSSELCHFLGHSLGVSAFRTFLKSIVAEENLNFWIEATEFKKRLSCEDNYMRKKAQEIFNSYCDEGSDHQVNLPCSIRTKLKTLLNEDKVDQSIFDDAAQEIYKLMVRDNYARFKSTPAFNTFFKSLGIVSG